MKTQAKLSSLMKIIPFALYLVVIAGCGRQLTLKTITAPGELKAGAPVTVDGQSARYVRAVGPSGEVDLVITNKLLSQTLRRGTVHVRERGRISLDTSAADPAAVLLSNGDVVPTQSKAAHIARRWSKSAALLIGLAVVVLGICVIKLLLFRMAGPLVPLILALLFAAFTGWILSPLLSPIVDKCYSKFALQANSTVNDQSADTGTNALGRWQSRLVESLGTRPDPRVIAFVVIGVVALPLWLWFVCRLRSVSRGICSSVVPTLLLASVATTSAAPDGVSFSRDFLLQEQAKVQRLVTGAEQACGTANRLTEAGLVREAAEELVLINFNFDLAEITLRGHLDRVANLKPSAFRYIATEEKRKLASVCALLGERLQECQKRASTLHQRVTNSNDKEAVVLQIYLTQQDRYRQRIQEGLSDSKTVLNEVRQLLRFGLPLVRAGLVNSENASRSTLHHDGTVTLLTGHTFSADGKPIPALAVVTNVVIRTNVVKIPTPAPPPVTNRIVEYVTNVQRVFVDRSVTNVVVVTKPPLVLTAANVTTSIIQSRGSSPVIQHVTNTMDKPPTNTPILMANNNHAPSGGTAQTNMAMTSNQAQTAPQSNTIVAARQGGHTSAPKMGKRMTLALIALGALVAISAIVWSVLTADRTWVVSMRTNGVGALYEIQASDRLVLDGIPHAEHHSLVNGHPHIRPTWKGATIHPGAEPLVINGAPVLKPQKLNRSDRITAHASSGTVDYDFLDCAPATEQASEE